MTAEAPARQVVLRSVPGLGGLYVRAARGAAVGAVGDAVGRVRRGSAGPAGGGTGAAWRPAVPDLTYRVDGVRADPDRLTAYQHLLGEPATDVLPAGFVHVLAFPVATALMARDDFPLRLLGMVHLANRVEQVRPLRLGEPLDVLAWARDLRPHRRGTQVDLVTEVAAAGDVAWRGVSTYLAPGVHLAGPAPEAAERPDFVPPLPTGRWRYDADRGRRYAAVSGDANPIHLSAPTGKAFGFPRAIAHGMDTAARALADVGAVRGDAFTWAVEFASPVLLPSTPSVRIAPAGEVGCACTVWDPRRSRLHLSGTVAPLPSTGAPPPTAARS